MEEERKEGKGKKKRGGKRLREEEGRRTKEGRKRSPFHLGRGRKKDGRKVGLEKSTAYSTISCSV